ncbi:uncharacterized protein [Apostichopus japonicus]|uniref:uncharacterized protein isoform X5 n=1 Tax=Stichopus japonicus TaxID=307972 RepID=UPI003AB7A796
MAYYLEKTRNFYFKNIIFVVLFMFFHRRCEAQGDFDCATQQPTITNAFMGTTNVDEYTVTVDQPYYQQGSHRRVTVSSGNLVFTHLLLVARIQNREIIEGWTSPLPEGYTFTFCEGENVITKVNTEGKRTATFEWIPPFTDTSLNVVFMATFVNTLQYFIVSSEPISDPCSPNPCTAGDVCFRGSSAPGYICTDACYALTCQNGGTCSVGTDGKASCLCPEGLAGQTCESCPPDYCLNGGMCIVNSGGEPQCFCSENYQGTRCQIPRGGTTSCSSNPCQNGGTCEVKADGSFTCTCPDSHYEDRCQTITFCGTDPCMNGGTCTLVGMSGGSCSCAPGFTGGLCESVVLCHNFCQNGGTCMDLGTAAFCTCLSGFSGLKCEIQDASQGEGNCLPNICQNGGTCVSVSPTASQCQCTDGYSGSNCEIKEDICTDLCMNGATCVPLGTTGASCICASGFTGFQCDTSDPCSTNPCFNGGTCNADTSSTFGYTCQCLDSYIGSLCQDLNPCTPQPCQNSGTCHVVDGNAGTYTCECIQIYIGDNCETLLPCLSNPCSNGGTCRTQGDEPFSCDCHEAFSGERCEIEDRCILSPPCQNGGTCTSTGNNQYSCRCVPGFSGPNCETQVPQNPCSANQCQNGGTCQTTSSTEFTCTCPSDHLGDRCEITNPCNSQPCRFNTPCTPSSDGQRYTCTCTPSLTGPNCETSVNVCRNSPCVNGTCVQDMSTPTHRRCDCDDGYSGTNCEVLEDYCLAFKPCDNGGICANSANSESRPPFYCTCAEGFLGDNCTFDRAKGPEFTDCPGVTVSYPITSNTNLANITLNPVARIPETGEAIEFNVITGPDIEFPSEVTYDEIYLTGQKFVLRATDQFNREGTCSFTVRLTDQVPPEVECPNDYTDVSSADNVEVASLPLPPIIKSDNIGLREENPVEFSPATVDSDGRERRVTVSIYDIAGNKAECQFTLTLNKQGTTCPEIPTDNGRVSCSLNTTGDRICKVTCDDGFAAPNGEYYTCRNQQWDKDPIQCAAIQDPVSVRKVVSFLFPLETLPCTVGVFLVDAVESMRDKLDELGLCRLDLAEACLPNSISATCVDEGSFSQRKRRQNSLGGIRVNVEISGVVSDSDSAEDVQSDVNELISNVEEAEDSIILSFGEETVSYSSMVVSPEFIAACPRGSVSRNGDCLTCPAGSRYDDRADTCDLCEAGTSQSEQGQSSCLPCDPGQFQPNRGATTCDDCAVTSTSTGQTSCPEPVTAPLDWVMLIIYICVGIGALLVIIIFALMICLWRSTQEEKKQDRKRWEIGQLTQLNKSYEPEEEAGFRPRVNTTVSASTYQTVPEGDGTPNLGHGYNNLVPIPMDELYAGIMMDSYGNTLSVGVDTHPIPNPRDQMPRSGYRYDDHDDGFMSSNRNRHNFPV